MKKLLFLLFFIVPILSSSQNKITLKSGVSFITKVQGFYGKNLVFYNNIPGTDTDRVNINMVRSIAGKMPNSRMKAIFKQNPDIFFLPGEFTKEDMQNQPIPTTDTSYQPYGQESTHIPKALRQLSAGDLVQKSARLRLTGYAIGAGVGVIAATGAFNNMESGEITAIAGVSCAAIIGFFLAGEFTLIKAGKKMNSDAVSVSAAKKRYWIGN